MSDSGYVIAAAYHTFDSQRLSFDYGDESDARVAAKWKNLTFTLKYTDYRADLFATDTKKVWFQINYNL